MPTPKQGNMPNNELNQILLIANDQNERPHCSSNQKNHLANHPGINHYFEKLNSSKTAKLAWALSVSSGMALYNYRKEIMEGSLSDAVLSSLVSLSCNIFVSYEFCLKSPFLAAAILSKLHKNPKSAIVVLAALISSSALTAQLVHQQPITWATTIGTSAFLNYAATRLTGLIDNDRSFTSNAGLGLLGLATFSPLVCVWLGDAASLFFHSLNTQNAN